MKIDEKDLMENYFPLAYQNLKKLIKLPSFQSPSQDKFPYGKNVDDALNYVLKLGKELGFNPYKDSKNRYGFLDWGNDGDELFVILCHLDVVPPGNIEKWDNDPFNPVEKDGVLYGRGSLDDKGPTMMNLFALKYLLDHNFKPKNKIRMIFGLTEETTWQSIKAYVKDFGVAKKGYVPDGAFPVVYAEKWIVDVDIISSLPADFEIKGGVAYNVVNDIVTYKGPKKDLISNYLTSHGIQNFEKDGLLVVDGKAGHGSTPWVGINAATWLAKAMFEIGIKHTMIDYIAKNIHLNFESKNIFSDLTDESGSLTQNLGIVDIKNNSQRFTLNYRVPVLVDIKNTFLPILTNFATSNGLGVELKEIENSVYIPKDSEMVKTMMHVYQEVTNDFESQPIAIGGGTYAKAMPGLVAFGADFDREMKSPHSYNESIPVNDLKKMLEIYTKAIKILNE